MYMSDLTYDCQPPPGEVWITDGLRAAPHRSKAEGRSQFAFHRFQIRGTQGTESALNHAPLNRAENAGDDGGKEETRLLPVLDDVIAGEPPLEVARDGRNDRLAAATVV